MTYRVKELYYTLQGEGAQAGRAAVFCRFAGCNLWSGHEKDRSRAICRFCDTDFVGTNGPGGGTFKDATSLASTLREAWDREAYGGSPFVVFTGGEPLLQLDDTLVRACHEVGIEVGVETNGTRPAPEGIDWLCVSPKAGAEVVLHAGDELKLVYPQAENTPADFEHLDFKHWFLQPRDGEEAEAHTHQATEYCRRHPRWRLSLQTHKWIGIP
jgi:7-carboxy-7-deazaguanine synthase (Cx14CxxC type)